MPVQSMYIFKQPNIGGEVVSGWQRIVQVAHGASITGSPDDRLLVHVTDVGQSC
jgi:hypothetical protein